MQNSLEKIRHSASHLLAMAVLEKFPEAKLAIGPVIENGFYYDFDVPIKLSNEILPALEKRMRELAKKNISFERFEAETEEANKIIIGQPYKKELLAEIIKDHKPIIFYRSANFIDLCGGPHVQSTKEIDLNAFKLLSVAGAYWRGDEKKQQLQRIYGVAFATKEELDSYLTQQAEALKRDHRKIGQELDLFTFSDLVGSGLPLYTPRGTVIVTEIVNLLNSLKRAKGYEFVDIPHLGKVQLYKISGHWDKYKDSIFRVHGHGDEFVLKPMNCPHHSQIYASRPKSWRDLPVRYAEVTKQYRDEQAGELLGLSRVRSITIDDTHIYCRPDQILDEMRGAYEIIRDFSKVFGLEYSISLSVRDPKHKQDYLGPDAFWDETESLLKKLLKSIGEEYAVGLGEASFYAPKIDFIQRDSLGRHWQLSTIQLDYVQPDRFKLEYTDEKGHKVRPAMIHIAVAGSLERFLSILLEHYSGNLPTWLSPVQVQIIPVGARHEEACKKLLKEFTLSNIRSEVDALNETVGNKIRKAIKMKIPYLLVIGDKEAKSKKLHIRIRGEDKVRILTKSAFLSKLSKEITERKSVLLN
ncbi:MAG: threonine--tRNA ligase [Patescibacteria group bacterium]|nr:threonine--tRNA ligase [Patescibacteria group bacterium]